VIHITIDNEATLDMLKDVYANKLNARSLSARIGMNARKRNFLQAVRLTAKVEGSPAEGDPVLAIYHLCLPRCDWDAPIKALQDAIEPWIGCQNDRVIRYAWAFLTRPGKETKKKPERIRQVEISLYNAAEEKDAALARAYHLLDWGAMSWQR
jgi:hypothetical protein